MQEKNGCSKVGGIGVLVACDKAHDGQSSHKIVLCHGLQV